MQKPSKFEVEAAARLTQLPQYAYQSFNTISLADATHRSTLQSLFKPTSTDPVAEVQLEIHIKDLPKTADQLNISADQAEINMQSVIKDVLATHLHGLLKQISNTE